MPARKSDTLTHWIKRNEENKKAIVSIRKTTGSFYCELNYETVAEKDGKYLLKIEPVTGKFHQIRAQLSFINCPIIGDKQYNSTVLYKENAICLHAYSLEFVHPAKKELMKANCDFPDEKPWDLFSR
jgi:23S rRNA pseudouridine1911/1915/1917 synthase